MMGREKKRGAKLSEKTRKKLFCIEILLLSSVLTSFLYPANGLTDEKKFDFSGYFQNFLIFKTDRDFERTPAFYEPWGQTAGVLGTYAEPKFSFISGENKLFALEFLLGFNIWSRNFNIGRPDAQAGRQIFIFARQLYSDLILSGFNVKAGYQYFSDPIAIFVRHWIGGVRFEKENLQLFLGQIPDQTYEGVELFANNFINDTYIFSIAYAEGGFSRRDAIPFASKGFFGGIYNLFDNSVVRKPSFVSTLVVGYLFDSDNFYFVGGLAGQGGVLSKSSFGLKNELHLAGAFQLSLAKKGKNKIGADIMLLSPDNPSYRDGVNFGFLYSGKSMSRTLLLTEDEIIFKSDNLDLNMAEVFSQFRLMRAGFFVPDVWFELPLGENFKITPVLGVGLTLSGENSLKSNFIGLEGDLIFSYVLGQDMRFDFGNIFFVPGRASASFTSRINPAGDLRMLIYSAEFSLKFFF